MTLSDPPIAAGSAVKPPIVARFAQYSAPTRNLLLALFISAVVLITRSALIEAAHSETTDAEFHLNRGIAMLTGTMGTRVMNDPPLGEALSAVPMWLTGSLPSRTAQGLYGYRLSPQRILVLIAIWKSILFLPLIGLLFWFVQRLYNTAAAWLATAMLLVEPTFAGHLGLPTVDVLGVEAIAIACILSWEYFRAPTMRRLVGSSLATAAALLIKHTAIIVPLVTIAYSILWWIVLPRLRQSAPAPAGIWRFRLAATGGGVVLLLLSIWSLTGFDFTPPSNYLRKPRPVPNQPAPQEKQILTNHWPAGVYIGSFIAAMRHNADGHEAYLFGKKYSGGKWYYFPVVATYKVPIGIAAILLLGLISLFFVRPRWDEWALLVPMVACLALLLTAKINIGFRHFLPVYLFMILLAARCLTASFSWIRIAAWISFSVAAIHTLAYHPDYLSYINFPRDKPYLAIGDSNVDWGQSLKQVAAWTKRFAQTDKRPVYLRYFGNDRKSTRYYLGKFLGKPMNLLTDRSRPPDKGILIISPVRLAGGYDPQDKYAALRKYAPDAVIGHSMLVFDLDKLRRAHPEFRWTRPLRGSAGRGVWEN